MPSSSTSFMCTQLHRKPEMGESKEDDQEEVSVECGESDLSGTTSPLERGTTPRSYIQLKDRRGKRNQESGSQGLLVTRRNDISSIPRTC